MYKVLQGDPCSIYEMYREYKDLSYMIRKYPDEPTYKEHSYFLENCLDTEAYALACKWSDITGVSHLNIITHIKSLCRRLWDNKITPYYASHLYLTHYYDDTLNLWKYRDGETTKPLKAYTINNLEGMPLLCDYPSNLYDGWQ